MVDDHGSVADAETGSRSAYAGGIGGIGDGERRGGHGGSACLSDVGAVALPVDHR